MAHVTPWRAGEIGGRGGLRGLRAARARRRAPGHGGRLGRRARRLPVGVHGRPARRVAVARPRVLDRHPIGVVVVDTGLGSFPPVRPVGRSRRPTPGRGRTCPWSTTWCSPTSTRTTRGDRCWRGSRGSRTPATTCTVRIGRTSRDADDTEDYVARRRDGAARGTGHALRGGGGRRRSSRACACSTRRVTRPVTGASCSRTATRPC